MSKNFDSNYMYLWHFDDAKDPLKEEIKKHSNIRYIGSTYPKIIEGGKWKNCIYFPSN